LTRNSLDAYRISTRSMIKEQESIDRTLNSLLASIRLHRCEAGWQNVPERRRYPCSTCCTDLKRKCNRALFSLARCKCIAAAKCTNICIVIMIGGETQRFVNYTCGSIIHMVTHDWWLVACIFVHARRQARKSDEVKNTDGDTVQRTLPVRFEQAVHRHLDLAHGPNSIPSPGIQDTTRGKQLVFLRLASHRLNWLAVLFLTPTDSFVSLRWV
jgi:hypothetical protein